MRIVSYNLRKHAASAELVDIERLYDVDVLCLQEADAVLLPETVGHLRLADATKANRLGLAIYVNDERFTIGDTTAFELKKSMHDRLFSPANERLIASRLYDKEADREILIASFHAAPLTAPNSLRRKQISTAHRELGSLAAGVPTVMVGDFNYPVFKNNLRRRIQEMGYELSLSNARTYSRYKIFRGHFDFVTSVNMGIDDVKTLPRGASDHRPILVTTSYLSTGAEPRQEQRS
ncbi:endonuclease/exonuclease/phosphatase family protein [Okibacterium sp. HSC-33S16]|uniref:endonuclease/exonuclease/phosphatase family protein n=1 Tax=Okibacterium sp. HSC-33S16 TaxID=2910965 RepID=UPI00209E1EF2|nr:endonuclease/exonuclease/phosphatase family protein [Okibacterium sp. HSC-33S16]